MQLPERFESVEHLEEVMTTPSAGLVADLARVSGDIVVLGVGGKMGPTLARLAKRAAPDRRVVGVARFSEAGLRDSLERHGVECIAADLLDRDAVARLSDADLGRRIPGGRETVERLVRGVAAHDLYHAGQIQLIKRMR